MLQSMGFQRVDDTLNEAARGSVIVDPVLYMLVMF